MRGSKGRLEKKLEKVDQRIERFNNNDGESFGKKVEKIWDFLYITDVAGSLIRRYQKPRAERFGWSEQKLTLFNAMVWGVGGTLVLSFFNQLFGDNISESFQRGFRDYYAQLVIPINFARASYSLLTKKAIGSASIYNLVGTSAYAIEEIIHYLRGNKNKPVEGFEPPTYS